MIILVHWDFNYYGPYSRYRCGFSIKTNTRWTEIMNESSIALDSVACFHNYAFIWIFYANGWTNNQDLSSRTDSFVSLGFIILRVSYLPWILALCHFL